MLKRRDAGTGAIWTPDLGPRRGATKHKRLTDRIIADVDSGVLTPGTRMPTHRDLAHRIRVSVQTVSIAYKAAERQGYLIGEVGRGTFVRARITERAARFMLDRSSREITDLSMIRAAYTQEHEAASQALMAALAAGENGSFMRPCRPIAGLDRHRNTARIWLERLGVPASREQILITNGAAHGVFLSVAAVVRPGGLVVTESLTDHGIIGLANVLGFALHGLPSDAEGIVPEAFEAACRAAKITALVVIPTFNNPTASVMGAARGDRRGGTKARRLHHRGRGLQAPHRPAIGLDRRSRSGSRLLRHLVHEIGHDRTAHRLPRGAGGLFDPGRQHSARHRLERHERDG